MPSLSTRDGTRPAPSGASGTGPRTSSRSEPRESLDAFPAGDAGLLRAAASRAGTHLSADDLVRHAERWRPWRAYAAQHLWAADAASRAHRLPPTSGVKDLPWVEPLHFSSITRIRLSVGWPSSASSASAGFWPTSDPPATAPSWRSVYRIDPRRATAASTREPRHVKSRNVRSRRWSPPRSAVRAFAGPLAVRFLGGTPRASRSGR